MFKPMLLAALVKTTLNWSVQGRSTVTLVCVRECQEVSQWMEVWITLKLKLKLPVVA